MRKSKKECARKKVEEVKKLSARFSENEPSFFPLGLKMTRKPAERRYCATIFRTAVRAGNCEALKSTTAQQQINSSDKLGSLPG